MVKKTISRYCPFKGTIWPDKIRQRVKPLRKSWLGHQAALCFKIFVFERKFLILVQNFKPLDTKMPLITYFFAVFRIRIPRIHMFLGLPDPLVRGMDPDPDQDPSIIEQK
jgi:hypothetical protein